MNHSTQGSLSITNSWSLPKLMSIELVLPSNHLIFGRPLLLPSIFPSIRVFSNESTLRTRWPKYWSFSFSIILSKEHPGLISFRMEVVGSQETPGVTGKFGLGIWNEAGQRLTEFYPENTLVIANSHTTTQQKTLHMNITRWSTRKSD